MMPRRVVEIMNYNQDKFGVIGSGKWRTVITRQITIKNFQVRIWSYGINTVDSIKKIT
mgnify:CR=1 FL=1